MVATRVRFLYLITNFRIIEINSDNNSNEILIVEDES